MLVGARSYSVLIVAAAALAAAPCGAQGPAALSRDGVPDLEQFAHASWSVEDGLPGPAVWAFAQGDDGYLWVGGQGGLARFDGYDFQSFNRLNTPAFGLNWVQALLMAHDSTLWIGFRRGGLVRLRDGVFESVTPTEGLPHRTIYRLEQAASGRIWIGSEAGLSYVDDGAIITLGEEAGFPAGAVEVMSIAPTGGLWAAVRDVGLVRVTGSVPRADSIVPALGADRVTALIADQGGDLWIGTETARMLHVDDGVARELLPGMLPPLGVSVLLEDRSGSLWLGTIGAGLLRHHAGRWSDELDRDWLGDDRVYSLFEDREGSIWVGTYSGGLHRLHRGPILTIAQAQGLSSRSVRSVFRDAEGSLWVAGDRGVDVRGSDGWHRFSVPGLPLRNVLSVWVDTDRTVWLGTTSDRLLRVENGRLTQLGQPGGPLEETRGVLRDREGTLWVGGRQGVSRLISGEWQTFTVADGLPANSVQSLYEGRDGSVWVGTEGGAARWTGDDFRALPGLRSARGFHQDADGVLWIGTLGEGLARVEGDSLTLISMEHGLFDDYVWMVFEDAGGRLWMCSDLGIFSADKSELNAVARGSANSVLSVPYRGPEGLRARECNGGTFPGGTTLPSGEILFPTDDGVAVVDPALTGRRPTPRVIVEQVTASGQHLPSMTAGGRARPEPGRRDLTFRYTAVDLLAGERLLFRYRLNGYDDDWIETGDGRSASYTNLDPGDYEFVVAARHPGEEWPSSATVVPLSIAPRFFETPWFMALAVLALGGTLVTLHRGRVRRLEERRAELETEVVHRIAAEKQVRESRENLRDLSQRLISAQESERGRLSRELHDELGQAMTAVHLNLQAMQQSDSLESVRGRSEDSMAVIDTLLDQIRTMALDLRPPMLDDLGLASALDWYTARQSERSGVPIDFDADWQEGSASEETESACFRIAQEAITNVLRHADATSVRVSLRGADGSLSLTVRDDGCGFDPAELGGAAGRASMGLVGMEERAVFAGGSVQIESQHGSGTTVRASFPLLASKGG